MRRSTSISRRNSREAGYAGVDIQKNPIGSRITVYVTRPGPRDRQARNRHQGPHGERRGRSSRSPTPRSRSRRSSTGAQPAHNGRSDCPDRRPGTAFRRAATWTMNSIMAAGASGVEIGVAGKLSERQVAQREVQDGRGPEERRGLEAGRPRGHHRRPAEARALWYSGQDRAEGPSSSRWWSTWSRPSKRLRRPEAPAAAPGAAAYGGPSGCRAHGGRRGGCQP